MFVKARVKLGRFSSSTGFSGSAVSLCLLFLLPEMWNMVSVQGTGIAFLD